MTRFTSRTPVLGSVSAVAMATLLGACSQPSSYATVDLSGSYGGGQTAQAYSSVTGQPVYQSVSLYGPQSFPDAGNYVPNAQLAYADAPANQVAALGFPDGAFDLYGIDARADAPLYSPQVTPSFNDTALLSSPQFAPEIRAVDQVLQAPAPLAPPAPFQQSAPVTAFEDVSPVSVSGIEEAPLAPPSVGTGYTSTADLSSGAEAQGGWPGFEPWIAPQYGSEEDAPQIAARPPVAPFAPSESRPRTGFPSLSQERAPQQPRQTRLPAPSTEPAAPPMRIGGGLRVPKASTEYPRPYALLRPGVWPELESPGQGLVEAPVSTPQPQLAAAQPPVVREPTESIATASERFDNDARTVLSGTYNIQSGDTLLTIAQRLGLTPQQIAAENGIDPYGAIYVGQTLQIPAAPGSISPSAIPESSVPLLNVAQVISDETPSNIGGPSVPTIDMQTVKAVIQHASVPAPTEIASTPKAQKQFAWPVHGDVYRLESGQVEIDPDGEASVAAAASGRVVHVERGSMGVLVVIEHDNGWRSLTVGLDYSAVRPGERVEQGSAIGVASRDHRVRFELRDADAKVSDSLSQLRG